MATIEGITTDTMELADEIAEYLGSSPARVVKTALMLLAMRVGIRTEIPRKEKLDGR